MLSRIPKGFYFDPTDEDLISWYLYRKTMDSTLQWEWMAEKQLYGDNAEPSVVFHDVSDSSPYWNTKEEGGATKRTIYVFTKVMKTSPNSKRNSRRAGSGAWTCQTSPKNITEARTGRIIGCMRMLSFQHPKKGSDDRNHWIMHEYSLIGAGLKNDIVLCKITKYVKVSDRRHVHHKERPEMKFPARLVGTTAAIAGAPPTLNPNELGFLSLVPMSEANPMMSENIFPNQTGTPVAIAGFPPTQNPNELGFWSLESASEANPTTLKNIFPNQIGAPAAIFGAPQTLNPNELGFLSLVPMSEDNPMMSENIFPNQIGSPAAIAGVPPTQNPNELGFLSLVSASETNPTTSDQIGTSAAIFGAPQTLNPNELGFLSSVPEANPMTPENIFPVGDQIGTLAAIAGVPKNTKRNAQEQREQEESVPKKLKCLRWECSSEPSPEIHPTTPENMPESDHQKVEKRFAFLMDQIATTSKEINVVKKEECAAEDYPATPEKMPESNHQQTQTQQKSSSPAIDSTPAGEYSNFPEPSFELGLSAEETFDLWIVRWEEEEYCKWICRSGI